MTSLVTRGYGPPGSVNLVVTRGYFAGAAVVPDDRNTGGWLSPEQVRNLDRISREADKAREKSRRVKKKLAETRFRELENIFDEVNGLLPEEVAVEVAEIVRPFSESSDQLVPPTIAIDWPALLRDMQAVSELIDVLVTRNQEEEFLLLMMA